jgi:hypothetical protein
MMLEIIRCLARHRESAVVGRPPSEDRRERTGETGHDVLALERGRFVDGLDVGQRAVEGRQVAGQVVIEDAGIVCDRLARSGPERPRGTGPLK